ncbi:MAG: MotE family protein [Bosea sp. (in: a-proteobacteria)]
MIEKPRLIPAVILGAMGLITLKVIGWVTGPSLPPPSPAISEAQKPEYTGFVKMMAKARAPYVYDPETTGSVGDKKKDEKKDAKKDGKADAKSADAKDAEAKQAEANEKPNPNAPRDRANMMNNGERPLSTSERALLERLGERRDELEMRMRELEMREKLLETVEKKVEGKAGELKQNEEKLAEANEKKNPAEAQGLKNLVVMYESMKPKDAARIFDRLTIDVLLPVVQKMNPRKMSEVLAAMSPEAAEKLTVAIASRASGGAEPRAVAMPAGLPATELPAIAPGATPRN